MTVTENWTTNPASDSEYIIFPVDHVATATLYAGVADAVWDESQSGHTTAGSFGEMASDLDVIDTNVDTIDTRTTSMNNNIEQAVTLGGAGFVNCEVNTANFAGSNLTVACILTDNDAEAVAQESGDLEGLEFVVTSGAQIREKRFIFDTTWDAGNAEFQLTLDRPLPGTLADAVSATIR